MKEFLKRMREKYPTLMEIVRFLIVGGLATGVDFLVMKITCVILADMNAEEGIANVIGTGCGFCVGLLVNYFLSVLFVFENKGKSKTAGGFFVFALLSAVGLLIHLVGMYIGNTLWGINEWIVKIFLTAVVLVYNYLSKRLLLFKKDKEQKKMRGGEKMIAYGYPETFLPKKTQTGKEKAISYLVACALSAAIIFGIFFILLASYNVFPFSGNCDSQYDLLAQIVPFAEHFFDVIDGNASFFYSYRVGGGMDVFGTAAYCLFSPFSWLFLCFGRGNAYYAASVMIPLKLTCIAVSSVVLMKEKFSLDNTLVVPVAVLYAFCGYTFVSNTYINWMDFLIWLPLAVLAFSHMRETGKIFWLSLSIAACIYTCFSIACFSMLISYPIFVVYAFLVVGREERKEYLFKISLCYLCGILAALPIMLPALSAYLSSGRNTGLFDSLWNDISGEPYYRKLTYILTDTLFVFLIAVYFVKNPFNTKESRFLGVAGLFIMMPVLVDECCVLMNMGSYMSYASRFGFLNAVYELYVSCLVLKNIRFDRKADFFEREIERTPSQNTKDRAGRPVDPDLAFRRENNRRRVAAFVALALVGVLAICVMFVLLLLTRGDGPDFSDVSGLGSFLSAIRKVTENVSSSFAHSTGALEWVAIVFVVVLFALAVGGLLYSARILKFKAIYPVLAAVLFMQTLFYSTHLVAGNIFNPIRYNEYNSLYSQIQEDESLRPYEYRVKDYGEYISDNQSLITKSNSYSVFSSVTDDTNFAVNRVFGFNGNGVNTLKSAGGTLFGDCLMGNKYVYFKSENDQSLVRPYLEAKYEENHFRIYENKYVFPYSFTVDGREVGVEDDHNAFFRNMQNLYSFLGGEGDVFDKMEVSVATRELIDSDTGKTARGFYVSLPSRNYDSYAFYTELTDNESLHYLNSGAVSSKKDNDELKYYFSKDSYRDMSEVYTFGYSSAKSLYIIDESNTLTVDEVRAKSSCKAISLNTLSALKNRLEGRAVTWEMKNTLSSTTFTSSIKTEKEGECVFLNYVSLKGYKAYVNGKRVELVKNGLNLIVVPLEVGENEVRLVYSSPYVAYGGSGLAIAVLSLVAIGLILKYKSSWAKKCEKGVSIAAVAIASVVVAFFMVFPTGVFIVKIVRLLL